MHVDEGCAGRMRADGGIAISAAVIGRCGDMVGVWIEPVTAQVIITRRPLFLRAGDLTACLVLLAMVLVR